MKNKLAIKGHATRGTEVIEILEMLGGKTRNVRLAGDANNCWYYIDMDGYIEHQSYSLFDNTTFFILEEFLEKYPYKVGDKVQHKGATSCGSVFEVEKMHWEEDTVKYTLQLLGCNYKSSTLPAEYLQSYKEETMEETDTINHTTEINLNHPCFDGYNEIELIIPAGWKFEQRGNKMFGVRKQYPKTYEECRKVLGYSGNYDITVATDVDNKLFNALYRLKVCRDAYWKIAGEHMGLGKPWKPDWKSFEDGAYPTSTKCNGRIIKTSIYTNDCILAFPTEEMRDAFFENFKSEIEQCKELL